MIDKENKPGSPRNAGGVFVALGTIGGAILGGLFFGQPSAGLLTGLALGGVAAAAIWLRER